MECAKRSFSHLLKTFSPHSPALSLLLSHSFNSCQLPPLFNSNSLISDEKKIELKKRSKNFKSRRVVFHSMVIQSFFLLLSPFWKPEKEKKREKVFSPVLQKTLLRTSVEKRRTCIQEIRVNEREKERERERCGMHIYVYYFDSFSQTSSLSLSPSLPLSLSLLCFFE